MSIEELKRQAGYRAAEYLQSGMVVGLGSGSTARYATLRLGELIREGVLGDILAIPTSNDTAALAKKEGITLTTLEMHGQIDVTIDGADEVDPDLNVIKGLGGFLLREKIVAFATRKEIIVVDETKLVDCLGLKSPVPVEVIQFGWRNTLRALETTGADPVLRLHDDTPFITDEGNYIVDCHYARITEPHTLSGKLNSIPGVVDNGLFLGMVQRVVIAASEGVHIMER